MSRTYTIYLVTSDAAATDSTLKVDADDCDLEYADGSGSPAFNFVKWGKTEDDDAISVAWFPFEMVRAIIS